MTGTVAAPLRLANGAATAAGWSMAAVGGAGLRARLGGVAVDGRLA